MIRALIYILVAALSFPASAQDLSDAEQAALAQRELNQQEHDTRKLGCTGLLLPTGQELEITAGVKGKVFQSKLLVFLPLLQVVVGAETDKFDILQLEELPNGGIGGKDFCTFLGLHQSTQSKKPKTVLMEQGVLLRLGLDLKGDYPNTSVEIYRRNQLRTISPSEFVALDMKLAPVETWYSEFGNEWMLKNGGGVAIEVETTLFVQLAGAD